MPPAAPHGTSSSVAVAFPAALGRIEGLSYRLNHGAGYPEEELGLSVVSKTTRRRFGGVQFMEVDHPSVRQYALTLSRASSPS